MKNESGNQIAFGLSNSFDAFKALQMEYAEYCNDTNSEIKANNLAVNAWHLADWVHKEFYQGLTKSEFRHQLFEQCPQLKLMHDIANNRKHKGTDPNRKKSGLEFVHTHQGAFSSGFSFGFDVTVLEVHLKDGTVLNFFFEIENVMNYWIEYFANSPGKSAQP